MPREPLYPHIPGRKEPLFPHVLKSRQVVLPQTGKASAERKYFWVEKNLPYDTWAIVEAWPSGTVRSPFPTKEEAIKREEELGTEYEWKLKRVSSPQEKFPKQHEALKRLHPYIIVEYHDNGDLIIRELVPLKGERIGFNLGKLYVVTTEGQQLGTKLPATEKLYQRGADRYPIGSDKLMRDAWGPIPNPDQPFWSGKGFIKPARIYGWQFSPDYNHWRAYVKFPDGTETWTSPRLQTAETQRLPQTIIEGGEPVPAQYRDLIGFISEPLPEYSLLTLPAVEVGVGEQKIDAVMRQLKAGVEGIQDSHQFRLFLTTMSRFHDYSIGNQILILIQGKDATHVAGFNTWKDLGRWVKGGEKGIAILAPVMPPRPTCPKCGTKVPKGAGFCPKCGASVEEGEIGVSPRYFKVVYVFDIAQTEGKPLPEFEVPVLTSEVNEELFTKVMALAKAQGLEVSAESRPQQDPAIKGQYSLPNRIWVRPEEPRAQQLKSLLHEVAHHYSEGVFRIPRRDAETIAESATFVVGAHYGFDSGVRSFPYVALWAKDKKVLEQNLDAIRKVATTILEGLEK